MNTAVGNRTVNSATAQWEQSVYASSGGQPAWGKLTARPIDGCAPGRHPLVDHMLDVAATFLVISRCPAVERALCQLAGLTAPMSEVLRWRLAVLAFLHDFGKANAGFQVKQFEHPPAGWPQPCGHVDECLLVFAPDHPFFTQLDELLPLHDICRWGNESVGQNLLLASISHHGRPVQDPNSARAQRQIWRPIFAADGTLIYDPAVAVAQMGQALRQHFAPAFASADSAPPWPDRPAFIHLFAGLVQLADWLGSDTRFFPFTAPGEQRGHTVWQRARDAVQAIGLDPNAARAALQNQALSFEQVFKVPSARPLQTVLGQPGQGALLILESETGSGKTEAALWHFAQLFQRGEVDSLYFALPTRVAASQLYQRLCEFAQQVWPNDLERPVAVRALAGYESVNDAEKKARLPDFSVLWADHPDEQTAHRRWAAETPKRFLAAPLAVGTVDQALMAGLQVRHAHLRQALLSRSLLVVDEVHASDAYMTRLSTHLLRAHLAAGGRALLLSATLGSVARALYQSVALGRTRPLAPPPLSEACGLPYPAWCGSGAPVAIASTGRSKSVHWKGLPLIAQPEAVAALALTAARQGARVLVVRNTVPTAVATFEAVVAAGGEALLFQVEGRPTLHHGRFSPCDRPVLDAVVQLQLGKSRQGTQGCIVIGTQTLEQSLDIDADLLITDLCPMDVLLQRLGRLHRHARPASERPATFANAQAWVLWPEGGELTPLLHRSQFGLGRFHQGGGVYPDLRILEATRRLVAAQPCIEIPADNRQLVEQATHPQALRVIEEEGGPSWVQHGQLITAETLAQRNTATQVELPFDAWFDDPDTQKRLSFPGTEEHITTRLGAADGVLTFDPPPIGPFGQPVPRLNLRRHLLPRGWDESVMPTQLTALSNGFEFQLGSARYRYDPKGLQLLSKEPT